MVIYKKIKSLSLSYYKVCPCRQLPTFRRNKLRPSSDLSNSRNHTIHKLATLKTPQITCFVKVVHLTPFLLFSKTILKFLSWILFPAMDLCNEVLSESQTKLKWESTAATSNTVQKYSARNEDLFFFTRRWNTVMVCEPLTEHLDLQHFRWLENWEGGDVTKQESGWKYEQMEPKLNALKLW